MKEVFERTVSFKELKDWLSPNECRAYLGISKSKIYEMIQANELPHRKFGRLIRIPKSAIEPKI
jgi:excisionase family DNA binding protein